MASTNHQYYYFCKFQNVNIKKKRLPAKVLAKEICLWNIQLWVTSLQKEDEEKEEDQEKEQDEDVASAIISNISFLTARLFKTLEKNFSHKVQAILYNNKQQLLKTSKYFQKTNQRRTPNESNVICKKRSSWVKQE